MQYVGHADLEVGRRRQLQRVEHLPQRRALPELLDVSARHDVVRLRHVALLRTRQLHLCQLGFQGKQLLGLLLRIGVTGEAEQPGRMRDEFVAQLDRLGVGVHVVAAVTERPAALPDGGYVAGRFIRVDDHRDGEGVVHLSRAVERHENRIKARPVVDGVDRRQQGPHGLDAFPVQQGLVHVRRVEVADLLRELAGGRVFGSGTLDDRLKVRVELVLNIEIDARAHLVGRDLRVLHPRAEDVVEEVVAGPDRLVHPGHVDAQAPTFGLGGCSAGRSHPTSTKPVASDTATVRTNTRTADLQSPGQGAA